MGGRGYSSATSRRKDGENKKQYHGGVSMTDAEVAAVKRKIEPLMNEFARKHDMNPQLIIGGVSYGLDLVQFDKIRSQQYQYVLDHANLTAKERTVVEGHRDTRGA